VKKWEYAEILFNGVRYMKFDPRQVTLNGTIFRSLGNGMLDYVTQNYPCVYLKFIKLTCSGTNEIYSSSSSSSNLRSFRLLSLFLSLKVNLLPPYSCCIRISPARWFVLQGLLW
jgi:hypothetical protein